MLRYVIKRLIYMIPTLFGMSIIAFLIIQLPPGDYITSMIASMADSGQNFDPAQIEAMRRAYGFGDPIWMQYLKWITGILTRDAASLLTKEVAAGNWPEVLRNILGVLEHDGYLTRDGDAYRFASAFLRDWWKARFAFTYIPVSERRTL